MSLYYLYKNVRSLISLATSVADEALLINGAVCIYHTFQMVGNVPAGSPVRNIRTPIGGTPAGYTPRDPSSASSYTQEYSPVLQFAFLVDHTWVIHVTIGTTTNLSRVTGTPINFF